MPDENKERLVTLLAGRGVPLIEDDLYGDLYFGSSRPRAAKSFDQRGLVLHCGSFSKTLAPGWRVGWVAAGKFRERVSLLKFAQTIATASLQQLAMADFLAAGHYERHLRSLRKSIAATMRSLGDCVAAHFPAGTRATRPDGGGVLWVEMPEGISSLELHDRDLGLHQRRGLHPALALLPERRGQHERLVPGLRRREPRRHRAAGPVRRLPEARRHDAQLGMTDLLDRPGEVGIDLGEMAHRLLEIGGIENQGSHGSA